MWDMKINDIRIQFGGGVLHVPLAWHTADLGPVKIYLFRTKIFSHFMCFKNIEKTLTHINHW